MRLVRTQSPDAGPVTRIELYEVSEYDLRQGNNAYAILSHTWMELRSEVLFSDLVRHCDTEILQDQGYISVDISREPGAFVTRKAGWKKVEESLKQAGKHGLAWFWADTMCIDKSSSAELSEAINSMFAWYERAAICYVFLHDVSSMVPLDDQWNQFSSSRWFTRGWTLQELLAPTEVDFFSREWTSIGKKRSLGKRLSKITGIEVRALEDRSVVFEQCIATRMSWAAHRETTRIEDRAYSLMGLFQVNMPMLYGEGEKAFQRLQHEIMRFTDDLSIFAWLDPDVGDMPHGLLADRPDAFSQVSEIRSCGTSEDSGPFVISNRGLSIMLHLTYSDNDVFAAALPSLVRTNLQGSLGIYLKKMPVGNMQFARIRCDRFAELEVPGSLQQVFVRPSFGQYGAWANVLSFEFFHLAATRSLGKYDGRYTIVQTCCDAFDVELLNPDIIEILPDQSTMLDGLSSVFRMVTARNRVGAAIMYARSTDEKTFALILGRGADFEPVWDVVDTDHLESLDYYNRIFRPHPLGITISTGFDLITVAAKTRVKSNVKMTDIEVYIRFVNASIKKQEHAEGLEEGPRTLREKTRGQLRKFLGH